MPSRDDDKMPCRGKNVLKGDLSDMAERPVMPFTRIAAARIIVATDGVAGSVRLGLARAVS